MWKIVLWVFGFGFKFKYASPVDLICVASRQIVKSLFNPY